MKKQLLCLSLLSFALGAMDNSNKVEKLKNDLVEINRLCKAPGCAEGLIALERLGIVHHQDIARVKKEKWAKIEKLKKSFN